MQEVLKKLEQIQELDLQIDSINRKKAEHPKKVALLDETIKLLTVAHDEQSKLVAELEKSLRQQNGALELSDERSKRSQEKLEQIKTNQEFQAITKELESLKKNSQTIVENSKKVQVELEEKKKFLEQKAAALAEAVALKDAEVAKMSSDESGLNSELDKLFSHRSKFTTGLDKRYLAQYDRLRGGRGGVGIVPAILGNCRGCNMKLPAQLYNELLKGTEFHFCPSCKRILVYKDSTKKDS